MKDAAKESMNRYYRRQRIELACKTVTPMFLGDAFQEAEWRAAPFKSLFRYWWRITRHGISEKELKAEEGKIFGAAGDKDASAKSPVTIGVLSNIKPTDQPIRTKMKPIEHPEYRDRKTKSHEVDPLLYLANMGLMRANGRVWHSYFPAEADFRLTLDFPGNLGNEMGVCLTLIKAFGTIGGRSRNGWGSFTFSGDAGMVAAEMLEENTLDWMKGFDRDYPNCLGRDGKGALVWKTADRKSWPEAMRELADTYVGVRARTVDGEAKLNPGGEDYPDERHLLGFPLQHHPAKKRKNDGWGNSGRHASPLRFTVKKTGDSYRGIILHLPFLFSRKMNPMTKDQQLAVWEKVHRKLDHLLTRATWEECLS